VIDKSTIGLLRRLEWIKWIRFIAKFSGGGIGEWWRMMD